MRKNRLFFLALALLLSACSSSSNTNKVNSSTNDNSETSNQAIQQQSSNNVNQVITNQSDKRNFKVISLDEKIELGYAQFHFSSDGIKDEIYPKDTSGVYMYYPDEENFKFVYLKGTIKNISNSQYNVEEIALKFTFDEKFEYYGNAIADAGQMRATDCYLDPLVEVDYYLCASIPDELANSFKTLTIQFGFKDNFEHCNNDFDRVTNLYEIKIIK